MFLFNTILAFCQIYLSYSHPQFDIQSTRGINSNYLNNLDYREGQNLKEGTPVSFDDYSISRSYPQPDLPAMRLRPDDVEYNFLGPLHKNTNKQILSRQNPPEKYYDGIDLNQFDIFDNKVEPFYNAEQIGARDENYLQQKFNYLVDMSEARFRPRSFEEKLKMAIRQRALQDEVFHNKPESFVSLLKELPRIRGMENEKDTNDELMKFSAKLTPVQMLSFRRNLKDSKIANDDNSLDIRLNDAIVTTCLELSKNGVTPPECQYADDSDDIDRRVSRGDVDNIIELFFCKIAIKAKVKLPTNCKKPAPAPKYSQNDWGFSRKNIPTKNELQKENYDLKNKNQMRKQNEKTDNVQNTVLLSKEPDFPID